LDNIYKLIKKKIACSKGYKMCYVWCLKKETIWVKSDNRCGCNGVS